MRKPAGPTCPLFSWEALTVQRITRTVAIQASAIITKNETPVAGRLLRFGACGDFAGPSSA